MTTDEMNKSPILKADGITKKFPGVTALDHVFLEVYRGEVHAIIGENGAGKSTLMKILSGVYPEYEGKLYISQKEIKFKNTGEAQEHGIAIIHQELNLIPHLNVAENVFLGQEPLTKSGFVDYKKLFRDTRMILDRLKLDVSPKALVNNLKVGQQQIVEIAKALSIDSNIIIMDEPTSALTENEVEILFSIIEDLKAQDVAVIYISHKISELFRIADRVTALRDGKYIGTDLISNLDEPKLIRMMVGKKMDDFFVKSDHTRNEELLRVEDLSLFDKDRQRKIIGNVSFIVRKGEVIGIFGLMGAGRTETFETLFGLHAKYTTGSVYIDGVKKEIQSSADAIKAGLALLPEDRKLEGLILQMNIAKNISLSCLKKIQRYGLLQRNLENRLCRDYMQKLRIKAVDQYQQTRKLSGGNQQKVVLAKWLSTDPQILLLDEPTRGIDINAKNEIYKLISELTAEGMGIIFISSELPEILAISDRILTMAEGRLTGEFLPANTNQEELLNAVIPRKLT